MDYVRKYYADKLSAVGTEFEVADFSDLLVKEKRSDTFLTAFTEDPMSEITAAAVLCRKG